MTGRLCAVRGQRHGHARQCPDGTGRRSVRGMRGRLPGPQVRLSPESCEARVEMGIVKGTQVRSGPRPGPRRDPAAMDYLLEGW
jgi:hypothetical protein